MSISGIKQDLRTKPLQEETNIFTRTTNKVIDFAKNNFISILAVGLLIASGIFHSFAITLGMAGVFIVLNIAYRILNSTSKVQISKHDPKKWLEDFNNANFYTKKQMLKSIGLQTLQHVRDLGVKDVASLSKDDLENMKKNTLVFGKKDFTINEEEDFFKEALNQNTVSQSTIQPVEVIQGDSFDVALHLKKEKGYKQVAVLNMANAVSPGGGFLTGCAAQEESLCRRSTLFDSININHPEKGNSNSYLCKKMQRRYNVPEFGAIYSPDVQVFRGSVREGFPYYDKPEKLNVISSAAYDLSHTFKPGNYKEKTKRKLQIILNAALAKNQELVVLGAYGCGAFGNNPKEVANIIREILTERPQYQQKMKIVFAIITDKNDTHGNLKAFQTLNDFVVKEPSKELPKKRFWIF